MLCYVSSETEFCLLFWHQWTRDKRDMNLWHIHFFSRPSIINNGHHFREKRQQDLEVHGPHHSPEQQFQQHYYLRFTFIQKGIFQNNN